MTPIDRIVAIRRTLAPQIIAGAVLILAEWGVDLDWLTDRPATLVVAYFALSAALYVAALLLGRRWPWIERALLTSGKSPTYTPPTTPPNSEG